MNADVRNFETMTRPKHKAAAGLLAVSLLATSTAAADTLTYEGIGVAVGSINGVSLAGQTATVSIEFSAGLTAFDSGIGVVFDLGVLTSATYTFSQAGSFTVDNPQVGLQFGSPAGFDLSFFDALNFDLQMLSGSYAGESQGMGPLVGESLGDLFHRLGDGTSISFVPPTLFQMLNPSIGGLNEGEDQVTLDIVGDTNSAVTLTYEPSMIGSNYCGPAELNSTGLSAEIGAFGSLIAADNAVTLCAWNLPPGRSGMFLNSMTQGFVSLPGVSQGNLCLSGDIGRDVAQVGMSNSNGQLTIQVDLAALPAVSGTTVVTSGQTFSFQCWFRDFNPNSTSNTTDGVALTFR